MTKFCKFTGVELVEGNECPIKKMCLNCASLVENEDGTFACCNEAVMQSGKEKVLAAATAAGFEIEDVTLKPMLLKAPTKKCGNYSADIDALTNVLKSVLS